MDLQALLQEHEELQGELRGCTDKAKKASCEVMDRNTDVLGLHRRNAWWDMHRSHIEPIFRCFFFILGASEAALLD